MTRSRHQQNLRADLQFESATDVCVQTGLLRLDIGSADDLAPFLGIFGDELGKIGGRAGQRGASHLDESRFDRWVRQPGVDLPVELVDDLGRRVPGRADTALRACLVPRHELGGRGQVRQCLQTCHGGHCQRSQSAGPDVLN